VVSRSHLTTGTVCRRPAVSNATDCDSTALTLIPSPPYKTRSHSAQVCPQKV